MGCCYRPAQYMAAEDNEAFVVAPASGGVWGLPRMLAFELQPQVEDLPLFRHSDSDGVRTTVCAEEDVTHNIVIDYFQCDDPPMTDFLSEGVEYWFRSFPNAPFGHADRSFTQEQMDGGDNAGGTDVVRPFFQMKGKARYGNRRFDPNSPQRVSQITLEGTSVLTETQYTDLRANWDAIYGSTPVSP